MEGLTEGRMVHFVLPNGEHRPAVVVKVWNTNGGCEGYVNLQVFLDGYNDFGASEPQSVSWAMDCDRGMAWVTSVCYSLEPKKRTWHWIEKA
jgi:hypothetical protein